MSGRRADFIRLTQRRDRSSPGDPATLVVSFTWRGDGQEKFRIVFTWTVEKLRVSVEPSSNETTPRYQLYGGCSVVDTDFKMIS